MASKTAAFGKGCCTRDQKEEDDEQWAWGAISNQVGCNWALKGSGLGKGVACLGHV